MKKAINLRTKDFILPREFYLSRMLTTLTVVSFITFLILGISFLSLYNVSLGQVVRRLEAQEKSKTAQLAPINRMEAEMKVITEKDNMIATLSTGLLEWSDYLKIIDETAKASNVRLTFLNIRNDNMVVIDGEAPLMSDVEHYVQALNELEFLLNVHFKSMHYTKPEVAAGGEGEEEVARGVRYEDEESHLIFTLNGMLAAWRGGWAEEDGADDGGAAATEPEPEVSE